ncbi:hypothetical protein [Leptospira kirschneri]|uniref:Uncharacterized protein n=2 Tax=Leptospira kirschneri TaxID=29507 RepID=A0A0E2AX36_9LEPT|nr:hypothetical protein [Leptospira kirschneri]EKO13483.1 hypothetical protein LEP1GSC081_0090 [Leptospira kirschneri str. H1]EMK23685.1 hypothetical protein LEP1GSC008_0507 [Leptospira kirschneri serovar Bulgarica str. Nikolaevo]UML82296.1 hypothetical protein FH602_14275 [Leptospira kirschneri]
MYDPSVFKKVLHTFSDREKIYDLLDHRFFEENSITKDPRFWRDRIAFLLELYKSIPKDKPHLVEKFKNNFWKKVISSGLVAYYSPALEMTFQEFPLETKKSIRNLFWKASNSDTSSAMDLIEKNIQESNEFASDMDIMIQVFQYPNIFEGRVGSKSDF